MEPDLIDTYVAALRERLRWHPDVSDIVDEVTDHLYEQVQRLVTSGTAADEAQHRTLERFGDLGLIARSLAQTPSGELALPSRSTRLAGLAGISAGVAWVAAAVLGATGGHTDLLTPWSLRRYELWAGTLAVALTLTTLTIAGVLRRAGRSGRPAAVASIGVGVLLTVAMIPSAWAVTVAIALLGGVVAIACHDGAGEADRFVRPLHHLAVAWIVGAVSLVLLDEIVAVGPVDEYGDHPVAWLATFLACATSSAAAIALIGVRLRTEQCPPTPW